MERNESNKKTTPFNLIVPLKTRMAMLRKFDSLQHEKIQDQCEHPKFKSGVCVECDLKCEHSDYDDNVCSDCGENVYDPSYCDYMADVLYDQWVDEQSERGE